MKKTYTVLYFVVLALATISAIPGFIVGSFLYFIGAMIFSIAGKDSIADYAEFYIFGVKAFIDHYKTNFLAV